MTAFHMACELGSSPIVEYLVSEDAALCRITLVDARGNTPLHMAASKNHVAVVSFLLEKVRIEVLEIVWEYNPHVDTLSTDFTDIKCPIDSPQFLELGPGSIRGRANSKGPKINVENVLPLL